MNNNQSAFAISSRQTTEVLIQSLKSWNPEHADLILFINTLTGQLRKKYFALSQESILECVGYFNQAIDCIENDHESYLESIREHEGIID